MKLNTSRVHNLPSFYCPSAVCPATSGQPASYELPCMAKIFLCGWCGQVVRVSVDGLEVSVWCVGE